MDTESTNQAEPASRWERWLPGPRLPRPLRWVLAVILWPIMAVMLLVGGALTLGYGLMTGAVVLLLTIVVLSLLASAGVEGFSGLAHRPLAFIPHNWIAGFALAAGAPLALWWARDIRARWRATDHKNAETGMQVGIPAPLGDWPVLSPDLHERSGGLPAPRARSRVQATVAIGRNIAVCAAAAVLAFEIEETFHQGTANAPWAAVLIVAAVAAAGYASYRHLTRNMDYPRRATIGGPIIALVCVLALSAVIGIQERSGGIMRDYCEYGAVSRAQLAGCLDHVTRAQIDHLQTDAARFAVGNLDSCLADAGPFCASRAASRKAAQNAPDPNQ